MSNLEGNLPSSNSYNLPSQPLPVDQVGQKSQPSLGEQGETVADKAAELRQGVQTALITGGKSMPEVAGRVMDQLTAANPEMKEKIEVFAEKYQDHMEAIKNSSWEDLKAQLGTDMASSFEGGPSLEEFRGAANALVTELCKLAGQSMGMTEVDWLACGTVGYNSDVDTALKPTNPKDSVSPMEAVLYKSVRDAIHTGVFGGLSGVQLDTESYVPHTAEWDLSAHLSSDDAKAVFQTGEKANVILQRYASLAGHPEDYLESKKADVASLGDSVEGRALEVLYAKVESFVGVLEEKITDKLLEQNGQNPDEMSLEEKNNARSKILAQDPTKYKEAREVAIIPLRLKQGERFNKLMEQIQQKEQKVVQLRSENNAPPEKISKLQAEIDILSAECQRSLTIINFLQDEGTNTAAEGKVTLFQEGGQIQARAMEGVTDLMKEGITSLQDSVDENLNAQKEIKKASNTSLELTQHLIRTGRSEVLSLHVTGSLQENLKRKTAKDRPSGQVLLMAACEEAPQFEHVINAGLAKGNPAKSAIAAGKYCQRTCRNSLRALNEFEAELTAANKPIPSELSGLRAKARKLERQATQLERCKRKFTLNTISTEKMLTDAIIDSGKSGDEVRVKAQVQSILSPFEFGGEKHGLIQTKEQHMDHLVHELSQRGLIDTMEDEAGVVRPKSDRVLHILQARVGYNRTEDAYSHLNAIHEQADAITTESLNLRSEEQVKNFANTVVDLGASIRNMALQKGLLPKSSIPMAQNFDLVSML